MRRTRTLRRLAFAATLIATFSPVARAQAPVGPRAYQGLLDEENWARLREPPGTSDFWDPVKYMRLTADETTRRHIPQPRR
jgi:hypothetical protein